MKILFVVSEVEDLVKTGGLADVAKALPLSLKSKGHDVRIVMPYYRALYEQNVRAELPAQIMHADEHEHHFGIKQLNVEEVPVYCVDYPSYFDRAGLYSDAYHAYPDNGERFAFFANAAMYVTKAMNFQPDIVHCNDWHTALVPYFMQCDTSGFFTRSRSLLTLHNAAFQGHHHFDSMSCIRSHQDLAGQLDGDQLNFLRIGIRYANKINAVSPSYADELLTPLGSHHLHDEFIHRRHDLSGILNGCDYRQWEPATDPYLPHNFDQNHLANKAKCKAALQQRVGLPVENEVPLIGLVSRLTEQKGFGYFIPVIEQALQHKMQLFIVGTGDPMISESLHHYANLHPHNFVFFEDFSVSLSHLVEAGSDFFLMPSLFEPCGLNQMYSLAYGTLPIVRAVGGLKDTITDIAVAPEQATGVVFEQAEPDALLHAIRRALLFYREDPQAFIAAQKRAMQTRFTWDSAAKHYEQLYQSMVA
jgi:starch synthase